MRQWNRLVQLDPFVQLFLFHQLTQLDRSLQLVLFDRFDRFAQFHQ